MKKTILLFALLVASTTQASTFGTPLVIQSLVAIGATTKADVLSNIGVYKSRTKEILRLIKIAKTNGAKSSAAKGRIRTLIDLSQESLQVQTYGLSSVFVSDLGIELNAAAAAFERSDFKALMVSTILAFNELNEVEASL